MMEYVVKSKEGNRQPEAGLLRKRNRICAQNCEKAHIYIYDCCFGIRCANAGTEWL